MNDLDKMIELVKKLTELVQELNKLVWEVGTTIALVLFVVSQIN